MRKTLTLGLIALVVSMLPSVAWAQTLDCAPTYEGQKVEPGASVQLEDGSWVTVTDAKACMGESLAHAAESAQIQGSSDSSGSSSAPSTVGSATTEAAAAGSGAPVPQGAANTGLGGLSDETTGLLLGALALGAIVAAGLGAAAGRRRAA